MMSVLKITGLALVALCTTGMGMEMAFSLSQRVRALELAQTVLESIAGELSYTLAPPEEIIKSLTARTTLCKAGYLTACQSFCRKGVPFPQAWNRAVREWKGALSARDREILTAVSETLGTCSEKEALTALEGAKRLLQEELKNAQEYAQVHGKLYRTLGMLSGVFLVILWI